MGKRGEGWVIGQFVIAAAIFAATLVTRVELPLPVRILGVALMVIGIPISMLGVLYLANNFTVFPIPNGQQHTLVTGGVYSIVRHPIYSGFALFVLGWTLWWGTLLGIALSILLFVWFDLKARREEAWLAQKFPAYPTYRARVKKLIPFVY